MLLSEDDDDGDFEDDFVFGISTSPFQSLKVETAKKETFDLMEGCFELCHLISDDELVEMVSNFAKETSETLCLPLVYTRLLLAHFRWDKARLMEEYFCSSKRLGILQKLNIPISALIKGMFSAQSSKFASKQTSTSCGICLAPDAVSSVTTSLCGHKFCEDCCSAYFASQTLENGLGPQGTITCPSFNCSQICDDDLVVKTLLNCNNQPALKRYRRLMANSFVEANRLMSWCPGEDCERALRVEELSGQTVLCTGCGASFCFACRRPGHCPVTCKQLEKWESLMKATPEMNNLKWVYSNTKPCPKCTSPIEKNGGCNHMTCGKCGHRFCWMCMRNDHYQCNTYVAPTTQNPVVVDLERLKHFINRFNGHKASMKLENAIGPHMQRWLDTCTCSNEVSFVPKAVVVLRRCRETLMNSFIFAYFLQQSNQLTFFESCQAGLERSTELLSGYLEREITQETGLAKVKAELPDKTLNCEKRLRALFETISDGHRRNWWTTMPDAQTAAGYLLR